ncbi:hypothetical protein GLOTRDRAFT_116103 [Gloeophyllum trabeum ATCC 11539]|uniref:Uncharacterized protein n=1 Tax=Gloeophyllum trabeum (strain ATCC 11539 / FP-39264 / Madison 617) TaxID=670483 RepID=S7Q942_GLOTA|nr:uncharacterized protein GLOTRDRAFT_116103 [Gloeophyllum trabeum ATCC 11539]EPQ56012.1 hypothetical protein GLOTRDRAFT_116103 [Gloeophyllum trabeum ATCC 11539]
MLQSSSIIGISLDAAGLIALADLKAISYRTALTGTSSFIDTLLIAPGIHCQQRASEVNGGEYPAAAALTSGSLFRIENQATVSFLQGIGKTGHLVQVAVSSLGRKPRLFSKDMAASILYLSAAAQSVVVMVLLGYTRDWWGLGVLAMLVLARLCNVIALKRRTRMGWKGMSEPDVHDELFIILSEDRWVRLRGLVDDLKAITGGQWLREESVLDSFLSGFATLLVYVSAALAGNASTLGKLLLACLLLVSVAFLGLCNSLTQTEGRPKAYVRRVHLVRELIDEYRRDDWAIAMGLIPLSTAVAKTS